ncbi:MULTISPECIES: sigma-54 interaction domain-containing protein [Peptostreptococcaceae]|uniref:PAS domain-containing protein n=2 Tax=Paraclostridium TaxID=1849822 RepID=A0A5P3XA02_PARBF|nr:MULTISPECIES: sigma 54-interacting transcriptional regulator [Paraclostridium]MBN8046824.1 sigma 54-interacting transcriptional regulator [Paraclostridium bifermentans]MBZ6006132.1 sigma 54-interacting transcriptional regulator [Paraclostridium bifermentans]MDU0296598.1 sigma 54-interacting transcriptional regulator [Paraclostridium sp. MRS3W1]NME09106.1 sigma 54-interacting transcriptional regulator [Paraclostridium bifermentans]QEZ68108.1 PAS domain-containing protein [Paraclostridium bif
MQYTKDFFERIVESSHDEIFVCDKDGYMIYCNKAFESNYGIDREDMIGKTAMFLNEAGYSNQTPIPSVVKHKKKVSMEQKTITGKTLIITATPVFDENGDIEFIVENSRDISELNSIKEKIKLYENTISSFNKSQSLIYNDTTIKGSSMKSILEIAKNVAKTNVNVLLLGESGCGKTTLAKHIHLNSKRAGKPFITINCSTISPNLLESELFGYEGGAFTGANSKGKIGLVELANEGTLFLDEIGDIPKELQSKFLQLIQDKTFTSVGGVKTKKVDIRFISATNVDLINSINQKKFREDLYYRINVVELKIPPLRDRKEDLLELIFHFFKKYSNIFNLDKSMSTEVINVLLNYNYPGNMRELENIIQNILVTSSSDYIELHHLPKSVLHQVDFVKDEENNSLDNLMENYEKLLICKYYKNNPSSYKLAKALNISQSKASRLIRKYL